MRALIAKFKGPTNTRGSRVFVSDGNVKSIYNWRHELDTDANYRKAFQLFVEEH
jgi:hypothetical protein